MVYRFIQDNHKKFGLRWLLRRLNLSPNAYYNFLKDRKSNFHIHKQEVCDEIKKIYHETEGKLGYRNMKIFLAREGIICSKTTVHKYMNKELGLTSIVKRKKPNYVKGQAHEIFPNLINQDFTADRANHIWCTDFTYLFLADGRKRYNCSIIDIYDRSIIASVNGKEITSELAINTLKKAIASQPKLTEELIIHSDYTEEKTMPKFCISYCC